MKTHDLKWATVHTITHEESGVSVQISRLDTFRPKYSLAFGRALPPKDGKPGMFSTNIAMRMHPEAKPWQIKFLFDFAAIIADLSAKAQEWVATDAATRYVDAKLSEEQRVADFNRPVARVTGKTAKKKERLAKARVEVR